MKKFILILVGSTFSVCGINQTVIPQLIPCITITQTNLPALGTGISAVDCIETDGTVIFNQNENYSIKAGEYISLGQNTIIDPDAAHQFHAYIATDGMDVAWYYPNATPGTVGQFEKLELGVRFSDNIETLVQNFNNEVVGAQINPFDPEELNLKAEFWYYSTLTNSWVGPQQVYGFYYEEFQRNVGGTYPDGQWILDNSNQHKFRIRFAPKFVGMWKCKISADVLGFGNFQTSEFTFECVPSDNPGFMRVGDNKRYFRRGDEPFFPVGHNLSWPRNASLGWDVGFHPITPAQAFEDYHAQLDTLKANGANYFRFINSPWATDVEFEKLGDYSDRMRNAWEMDQIILKAEELEFLIHWNLDIGSAFTDRGVVATWWDWTKEGDPHEGSVPCALYPGYDKGYCYHTEIPECVHPIDFLTSETAQKNYKNKLRYLIARYSYSTSIGMIELFSEMNHFGKEFLVEYDSDLGYCKDTVVWQPYTSDPDQVPSLIYTWNQIMTEHIQAMNIYNHPVALNYAPEPDFIHGDFSYALNSVDVMSWNNYVFAVERFETDFETTQTYHSLPFLNKPLIHSEFGAFGQVGDCDNGSEFKKILCITPFIGAACSMNWHWQYPGETQLWPHIGIVQEFMSGIKLDEENWQVGEPQVTPDKAVEMFYLRNFVDDSYRACGVISNRTYNFYTQSTGTPCNQPTIEINNTPAYQNEQNHISDDYDDILHLPEMGFLKHYTIEWVNALTGATIFSENQFTNLNGELVMQFPTLTGGEQQPIVFFRVYPLDEASFKSAEMDKTNLESTNIHNDTLNYPVLTEWSRYDTNNDDLRITATPNPTSSVLTVRINFEEFRNAIWLLTNENGELMQSGNIQEPIFALSLTNYSNGVYYLCIVIETQKYVEKIVKQ